MALLMIVGMRKQVSLLSRAGQLDDFFLSAYTFGSKRLPPACGRRNGMGADSSISRNSKWEERTGKNWRWGEIRSQGCKGKNNKGKEREGQCAGKSEVGVEHRKEIEGFHLPTASLCLSAQRVIKEPANGVP